MRTKIKNGNLIFTIVICSAVLISSFGMWKLMQGKIENEIYYNPIEIKYHIESIKEIAEYCIENSEPEFEPCFYLSDNERYIVESIVAGEVGHDTMIGKMAVAQCILNACRQDEIQPSEVRTKYKYSGWYNIDKFEINYPETAEEIKTAVWCVFDNGEVVTQENILWFYNPDKAAGKFHNTQKYVDMFGNHHRFYAPWE